MGLRVGKPLSGVTDDGYAVLGINLNKTLDKGPMAFKIFDHLDIHVKKNTIYGLLGASGCGKTTLLKCLLGLLPVDHGEVWILGGTPNTSDSGVPGYQVGYMPQDVSLLPEHTVRGSVRYFGGLAGKTKSQVDAKYKFFEELVGLPKPGLRLKTLSGGDRRKVSLVCALIHEPALLILDEPTAGLEPKTREVIWTYLKRITRVEKRSTVIITTHYIEEAGGADMLGILRNAHMIAEEPPARLMRRHRSLEEAVVLLSHEQDGTRSEVPVFLSPPEPEEEEAESMHNSPARSTVFAATDTRPDNYLKLRFYNTCHKNMVRLIQNPTAAAFSLVFPLIIIAALFIAIGEMPQSRFAVFNEDLENYAGGRQNSLRSGNLPRNTSDPSIIETHRGKTNEIYGSTFEGMSIRSHENGTTQGSDKVTQESIINDKVNLTDSLEVKRDDAAAKGEDDMDAKRTTTQFSKQTQRFSEKNSTPNRNPNNTVDQEVTSAGGNIEMKSNQETMSDGMRNLMRSIQADTSSTSSEVLSTESGNATGPLSLDVTTISGVQSEILVDQIYQTKNSTNDVSAKGVANLNSSFHPVKRSTAKSKRAIVSGRLNNSKMIGYHEDRISDLVEKRGGLALPNLTCQDIERRNQGGSDRVLLSCVFLNTLQEMGNDDFQLDYFQDPEQVRRAVEGGKYRGYFLIYKNYTPSLERKFRGGISSMIAPVSPVYVGLDMTDKPAGLRVQQELLKVQQRATEKYRRLLSPETDGRYFKMPVTLGRGEQENDVNFVAPGVMIAMTFFLQSGLTSGSVILERNTGLWERHSVLGVTTLEIVTSHLLVNSVLAFVQSALVIVVVYFVYAVPCHGSLLIIFVMVFLQAITGELFGFLCSVFSRSITEVNFINLGLYYPVIHMCGVVWPLEKMSKYIRPLGYMFPLTYPIEAIRSMQFRNGGDLLMGFVSSAAWIALFAVAIFATVKFRHVG